MRSGCADDLEECDHKPNVVVDEAESWRRLNSFRVNLVKR